MSNNSILNYAPVSLARQPIVDNNLAIMGYELLYRKSEYSLVAEVVDDIGATAQVITASLLEIGMDNLVGSNKAFVNFPRSYLLSPSSVPLDPNKVVVEVLEGSGFDAVLLASLRRWVKKGFKIALDDFVFEPKLTPFVELADYVKLDILALGQDEFHRQVEALRGFDVKIIAEKIETWDEYHFCRLLEVDLFQGYFFERPETISSKGSKVNSMTLLQLMAEMLKSDDLSINELERIVSQDVGLVHKLLRYLNSPYTGLVASVDSVRLAISLIGINQLKALTNLLLMSEMTGDRPVLLEQIMVRAKHAELFAKKRGYGNHDKYFLAGMLSMIDVCTGMSLGDVLKELPLPNEFINAIINRAGRVGQTLDLIEYYDNGRQVKLESDIADLRDTYLEAIQWTDQFVATF
ncbi:EAL and HDOD domain-containing protein [Marinomonas spartinae]|uniref:EAL and HDOD domain-containing protein n=1 Tax=Marinomonas spartinae TaxID=1792290 RepID=UPI0018F20DCE|nr:HDOD domain-containing protein [Marinomonas spartinae]MBJ7556259.1 HDOD domain-containing protein [Marinomonas spartinae]